PPGCACASSRSIPIPKPIARSRPATTASSSPSQPGNPNTEPRTLSNRHRKPVAAVKRARPRQHVLSALVLLAAVAMTAATFAQPGDRSPAMIADVVDPNPNFDIRTYKLDPVWEGKEDAAAFMTAVAPPASLTSGLAADRIAGVAALEARHKGVIVANHAALGTTEIVSVAPGTGFLTGPSGDRASTLRAFLAENAAAYGLSAAQVAELELVADYMNPAG